MLQAATPRVQDMPPPSMAMPRHLQSEITVDAEIGGGGNMRQSVLNADLKQVEALTQNVRSLLNDNSGVLEAEGLRYQVETLERCVDYYRRGIAAARIMSEFGHDWLDDMRLRLQQAVDEQNRYDGEGASHYSSLKDGSASRAGDRHADALAHVARHADAAHDAFSDMFARPALDAAPRRDGDTIN